MTTITIPDNIPHDGVQAIEAYIKALAEADMAGGIFAHGTFVMSNQNCLTISGAMNHELGHAVGNAIIAAQLSELRSRGADCNCPKCQKRRGINPKPDDIDLTPYFKSRKPDAE